MLVTSGELDAPDLVSPSNIENHDLYEHVRTAKVRAWSSEIHATIEDLDQPTVPFDSDLEKWQLAINRLARHPDEPAHDPKRFALFDRKSAQLRQDGIRWDMSIRFSEAHAESSEPPASEPRSLPQRGHSNQKYSISSANDESDLPAPRFNRTAIQFRQDGVRWDMSTRMNEQLLQGNPSLFD